MAKNEKLTRTTHRSDTVEDTTSTVRETTRGQERDVQATDRFGLQRESADVLRSDATRQPGSPGSASYGVIVETGGSSEQVRREVGTFGRDVTTRAVGNLTERLRTETTRRTTHEFSEEVVHEVDNSTGETQQVFLYQWLDRISSAQVFSYGTRLFYDMVVPEPAALVARAVARRHAPDGPSVEPAPFTLQAWQLHELNYGHYVAGYGATGVEPPPEPQVVVSKTFANVAKDSYADQPPSSYQITQVDSATLAVPPGYRAVKATVRVDYRAWPGEVLMFGLVVGTQSFDFSFPDNQPWERTVHLDDEVGTLPLSFGTSGNVFIYTVNVEVVCEPTDRRMDEWRQRTHDTILQAARQRRAEHDERTAGLRAAVRMEALSLSPDRKRAVEREELQRSCLAVLTNQQFDGLGAIGHSPQGYPQPFLPNVEPLGRYVRFLQQAFEWEQMAWRYHPYFWGRKPYWLDKLLVDDTDVQFRDFLRAGAARVQLPVRPGFEGAVAHFMDTGTVPTSDALAQMASGAYVAFLGPGAGEDVPIDRATPVGDAWEVRTPTTLVKLRADPTLPTWSGAPAADGRMVWTAGAGDPL